MNEEIEELLSIISEGQNSIQLQEIEKYITNLQKENQKLNKIIDELEKWLDDYYKSNRKWYNYELSNHDRQYFEREYRNTEFMIVKFLNELTELKKEVKPHE